MHCCSTTEHSSHPGPVTVVKMMNYRETLLIDRN